MKNNKTQRKDIFAAHALQGLIASGYFLERYRDNAFITNDSRLADLAWQMSERMIADEPFVSPEIEDNNICAIEPSDGAIYFDPYAKASGLIDVPVYNYGDNIDVEKYNYFIIFDEKTSSWLNSKGVDFTKVYWLSRPGTGSAIRKRNSWEQILHIMDKQNMPITEKQRNFFL